MVVYSTNRPRDKHREQELKVKCIELTLVSFLPEPFTVPPPVVPVIVKLVRTFVPLIHIHSPFVTVLIHISKVINFNLNRICVD